MFSIFFNENSKRKTLLFQEKKEALAGLLEAFHNAAIAPSETTSKNLAYWKIRCEIVCSPESRAAIEEIINSNEDYERRLIAVKPLKTTNKIIGIYTGKINCRSYDLI